jgi:hypothetical protein
MVDPSSEVRESTTRESGWRQNGQCTVIPFELTRRRRDVADGDRVVNAPVTVGHATRRRKNDPCATPRVVTEPGRTRAAILR